MYGGWFAKQHSWQPRSHSREGAQLGNLLWVLPNHTWVRSPMHSKANLLTPGCGEGKCSIYCKVPDKESGTDKAQKSLNSPMGFRKGFLNARWGKGVAGCVISSCTILWFVDGEVTGQCHIISPQALVLWGLCVHGHQAVNFFHLLGVLASVDQLRNVHQILLSMYFREKLKILWLIYGWFTV